MGLAPPPTTSSRLPGSSPRSTIRSRMPAAMLALIALAAGSLLAVAARIVLLAYLDATSIPAANVLYASPATPLLIVFAVTGTYLGWISLRMLWLAIAFERHGWRGAFIASPWSGREAANAGRADNSARAATRAR